MRQDTILSLRDFHPSLERFTADALTSLAGSTSLPQDTADEPTVPAEVNHGRWLARCPFCTGAELVDLQDHRFFCLSCENTDADRQWLAVDVPDNRELIEQALLQRPDVDTRNWLPGESLADLKAENVEQGV